MDTKESIEHNLNNLYVEYQKFDIKFNTFDEYVNDYINRIKSIYPSAIVVYNIKTFTNIWKNFCFKIVLKYNNFIIWNIGRVQLNNFVEYKNVSIFRVNYENKIRDYIDQNVYSNMTFTNYEETKIYNHGSLVDYIKNEHPITIKEILEINSINLNIEYLTELQHIVDEQIPNENTIIFSGEQYKLYDYSTIEKLNSIIVDYVGL